MKNMKKFVAMATALTMVLAPMTTFASDLAIEGGMNYVDKTIYKLTLPTSENMNFTLDPQGLLSLEAGAYDEGEVGKIVSDSIMTAVNESSVDVKLSAKFYLVDSASKVTLSDTSISDEEANEIAMVITSSIADNNSSTTYPVLKSTDTDATAVTYEMTKATYTFEKNAESGEYEYVLTPDSGSEIELTIGGKIAKDADWSAYTGNDAATITLHAVFEFQDANGDAIEVEPEVVAPTEAYAYFSGDSSKVWLDLSQSANGGLTDSGKLTSVKVAQNDGAATDVTYSVSGNYGLVTWTDMKTAGCTWKTGDTFTFTFVYDGTTYEATVTTP